MKISRLLFLFVFSLGVLLPNFAYAAEEDANKQLTCVQDYYSFIFNVRSENTRQQGVKDAFTLSICQLTDIFALDEELDALRADFRHDATFCEDTSGYKTDYNRILMEMYFVRNVQTKSPGVFNEDDYEKLQANQAAVLDALYKDMHQAFVLNEGRVSKGTFDSYFDEWSRKYAEKIGTYARCDQGAWAELNETLNEFKETMSDIKVDVDKYERETGLFDFKERVGATTDEDSKKLFNALKSFSFKNKNEDEQQAEIEPALTVQDVSSIGPIRLDSALSQLEDSALENLVLTESASRLAEYQSRYGEASAVTTSLLQDIIGQMNVTIEDANVKHFPAIESSVAKIYDRQCN